MTVAPAARTSAVPVIAAVVAIVAGALVLSGWVLDIPPLTELLPGTRAMKATTAIGLVAMGLAIWLLVVTDAPAYARIVGGFVLALGALSIQQNAGQVDLPGLAGRMSLPASVCLMLLGASVLTASVTRSAWAFQLIALASVFISAGVLFGYLFGIDELSRFGSRSIMAPYSALALLILSLGVLWLRPADGITGVIVSERLGGRMARQILPAIIVTPILAGWFLRLGQRQGWYDASLETALVILTTLSLLSVVVWRNARLISEIEDSKLRVDAALREARETLESRIAARTSEITRTHQEAVNEEVRRRQRVRMESLGQLAGSIAHDVNNMMTVVTGYSTVLLKRLGDGDGLREPIKEIKKAGDRCSTLTRQLLAFGRRQVLVPTVVDLGDTVSDLRNLLPMMVGDDVKVKIAREPGLWAVRVDSTQIEQVVINLVVNARDAMPGGGTLSISTANVTIDDGNHPSGDITPGDYVAVTVADSGVGMDSATVGQIFDPFFTTKSSGAGLGLSTAYGVVRQSGGNITVESQPGVGTTFRIYLPRVHEAVTPVLPPADAPLGFETVLLVEDDDAVRDLLKLVLDQAGYWVLSAGSGDAALELARKHTGTIELMVSDVVMPGLNGPELARRLVTERQGMRVLLVSGYPKDDLASDLEGVDAEFMQKPVTPEAFLTCVRELLDR